MFSVVLPCQSFLRFKLWGANSCKVRVNGKDAGICCWEPFAYDLSGLLQEGNNTLELELTTSLRNMLGPHHLAEGESFSVCPRNFYRESNVFGHRAEVGESCHEVMSWWDDDICLVHYGLK